MSYSKSLSQEAPCHFDAMPENAESWKVRAASSSRAHSLSAELMGEATLITADLWN